MHQQQQSRKVSEELARLAEAEEPQWGQQLPRLEGRKLRRYQQYEMRWKEPELAPLAADVVVAAAVVALASAFVAARAQSVVARPLPVERTTSSTIQYLPSWQFAPTRVVLLVELLETHFADLWLLPTDRWN
jgi:hypothetical protein